jgi:glycosyltransferase involved in cell wall biosynthesis
MRRRSTAYRFQHAGGSEEEMREPLGRALSLLGIEHREDADKVLCLDGLRLRPESGTAKGSVVIANPASDDELRKGELMAWVEGGATVLLPTVSQARLIREQYSFGPDVVKAVAIPLPPMLVPPLSEASSDAPMVAPTPDQAVLFRALRVLRRLGGCPRAMLWGPSTARLTGPGGLAGLQDLMAAEDVDAIEVGDDLHEVPCCTFVLSDVSVVDGWLLRRLLATAKPLVAPGTPAIQDHLAALGLNAYLWSPHEGATALAEAIWASLRLARGPSLGSGARAAVVGESWAPVALQVSRGFSTGRSQRFRSKGLRPPSLRLLVITPWEAGVSGARFLGETLNHLSSDGNEVHVRVLATSPPVHLRPERSAGDEGWAAEFYEVPREDLDDAVAEYADQTDVIWCSWARHLTPPSTSAPIIATVHDLNWRRFDSMSPQQVVEAETLTPMWLDRATVTVCSSEAIRREIRAAYGMAPDKVRVVPLTALPGPPDSPSDGELAGFATRRALPPRFLLYPAVRSPHKNHAILVRAALRLRDEGRPINIVLTGAHTDLWYHGPDLLGLGYVTDRELDALYRLCCGVVLPSLYEAGSFPMFEAMKLGRPVACSDIPAHFEQLARTGTNALTFDATSAASAAAALDVLFCDSAAFPRETIERNSAAISARQWSDVARDYLSVFRAALSASQPAA